MDLKLHFEENKPLVVCYIKKNNAPVVPLFEIMDLTWVAFDRPNSGIRIRGVMIKTECLARFEVARIMNNLDPRALLLTEGEKSSGEP